MHMLHKQFLKLQFHFCMKVYANWKDNDENIGPHENLYNIPNEHQIYNLHCIELFKVGGWRTENFCWRQWLLPPANNEIYFYVLKKIKNKILRKVCNSHSTDLIQKTNGEKSTFLCSQTHIEYGIQSMY